VRLAQVFSNLLNNAAKYTAPGGRIWLMAESDDAEAVVRVIDNGIGIASDLLPKVFEMFTQGSATLPNSQSGLGVGLSLSRGIVELHGGRLEVRSAGAGHGSEFIVRLPQVQQANDAVVPGFRVEDTRTPSRRLLVVDDNADNADSLAILLRSLGHVVRTNYDGAEGLKTAEQFQPEALFLDIGMPKLDGLEMCRRIRAQPWGRAGCASLP
jgi:hypothetical protein